MLLTHRQSSLTIVLLMCQGRLIKVHPRTPDWTQQRDISRDSTFRINYNAIKTTKMC
jgi:hypothetical protein